MWLLLQVIVSKLPQFVSVRQCENGILHLCERSLQTTREHGRLAYTKVFLIDSSGSAQRAAAPTKVLLFIERRRQEMTLRHQLRAAAVGLLALGATRDLPARSTSAGVTGRTSWPTRLRSTGSCRPRSLPA